LIILDPSFEAHPSGTSLDYEAGRDRDLEDEATVRPVILAGDDSAIEARSKTYRELDKVLD
jgi:hypothetical protein